MAKRVIVLQTESFPNTTTVNAALTNIGVEYDRVQSILPNDGFEYVDLSIYDAIVCLQVSDNLNSIMYSYIWQHNKIDAWLSQGGKGIFFLGGLNPASNATALAYMLDNLFAHPDMTNLSNVSSTPIVPTHPIFTTPNTLSTAASWSTPTFLNGGYWPVNAGDSARCGLFDVLATQTGQSSRATILAAEYRGSRIAMIPWISGSPYGTEDHYENLFTWILFGDPTDSTPNAGPPDPDEPPGQTPGEDGYDEVGFKCDGYAARYDDSSPAAKYDKVVGIDFGNKIAFTGKGYPFSCSLFLASDCSAAAEIPDRVFMGDEYGYVSSAFGFNHRGLGPYDTPMRFVVTAGDANSVTVNTASGGMATYGDGLRDMVATLVKTSGGVETYQARRIVINSSSVAVVNDLLTGYGASWDSNPAAGDILYVGLIEASVEFQEAHFQDPAHLNRILLDYQKTGTREAEMKVEIRAGSSVSKHVNDTTADATQIFDTGDLDINQEGVFVPPVVAKGLAYRLKIKQPDDGDISITAIQAKEWVTPREVGK